jgi:hypothetical protein
MRHYISSALLLAVLPLSCTLGLASATPEARSATVEWLSQQFQRRVDASQVLAAPADDSLDGCVITRVRATTTGATLLRLRCPSHALPQLILLHLFPSPSTVRAAMPHPETAPAPMVRAGTVLQAYWRTPQLHAQLPVVAIESGAAGGEIRVRVANTTRIMRARIVSAHTADILSTGA